MNKNLKVVSSLALAGILATTGLTGLSRVSAAEVTDPDTRSLGKYASLGGVENVVPYILNGEDKITVKDLKKEFDITAFNGTSVASEDTVVGTGDTFKSGNTTYTVIVYGDTNGDGLADSDDAFDMLSHYVGNKTLSGIYLEAANVEDTKKNAVDSDDAFRTKSFFVGNVATSRDEAPANLQPVEGGYTLVINENNIINNQNEDKVSLVVKLDTTLSKKKENLIVRILDQNGEKVGTSITANDIGVHMDQVELAKNEDLTTLANGTYTVELVENEGSKEKVLARTTVVKNNVTPEAVKVNTVRTGWETATLSLESKAGSDITKVYYVVKTTAPASFKADKTFSTGTTYVATATNSALVNEKLKEVLKDQTATSVHFVLENSYGSLSGILTAPIKDGKQTLEAPNTVDKATIKSPDLKKGETDYTWTAPEGITAGATSAEKYKVVVYKDGEIIAENNEVKDEKYPIANNLNGVGKYKIEISTIGNDDYKKDSAYVMSGEVEVKAINKAQNIAFEISEDGDMLKWNDTNETEDVNGYNIVKLYKYDETNKKYVDATSTADTPTKNEDGTWQSKLTIVDAELNTALKVEIKAIAKNKANSVNDRIDIVDSEVAELEGFFKIDLDASYESNTDTSVTLDISSVYNKTIKGNKLSNYRVEAYKATKNHKPTEPEYVLANCTSKLSDDGKHIVINGLEPNTDYVFKVYATVNGKEGQSDYIQDGSKYIKTYMETPEIKNKTVVKNPDDAKEGTVYYDNLVLTLDGKAIDVSRSANYSKDFKDSVKVIGKLNKGDIVTLDGDKIELKLGAASNDKTINFGDTVKDKVIEISGDAYDYKLQIPSDGKAKELKLSGNNAKYHLTSGVEADKILVDNNVVIDGYNTYNVLPGTSTINGVKVTTEVETEINSNASKELEVVVKNAVKNNLVFENLMDNNNNTTEEAKIKFVGDGTNRGQQLGTIVIKTNNGKVTVSSTDVNVDSKLNVEVEKGSVDITDPTLTGSKNITVSHVDTEADSKITFKVANKVSFKLTNTPVQKYETGASVTGVTKIDSTDIDMEKVIEFLNSFKLTEDAKATLTTTDGETFTLTISGDVTNYTIPEGIVK